MSGRLAPGLPPAVDDGGDRIAQALDGIDAGFALLGNRGEVIFANRAWHEWHQEALGLEPTAGDAVPEPLAAALAAATASGREWLNGWCKHLDAADGSWNETCWQTGRWVRAKFARQDDGTIVASLLDVSEQHERELKLYESAERFRSFATASGDCFWELDKKLCYRMRTENAANATVAKNETVIGQNFIERLRRFAVTADEVDVIARTMASREPFRELDVRLVDSDGNERISSLSGTPFVHEDGSFHGYRGIGRNVTEAYGLARRLKHQATHDDLTGLANRAGLIARINSLIAARKSSSTQHALCFLDIDQIKVINDTCGHAAGDALINRVAQILHNGLRGADTVARLGGDEYAVLLSQCDPHQAQGLAEKIRKGIANHPFNWEGQQFRVTVSVGVAPLTDDMLDAGELLRAADSACYAAKERGRNRVKLYSLDDSTLNLRQGEMHWVARIHAALAENRLQMYLQPIAPAAAPTGTGNSNHLHFEALLRMNGKDGRIFPPGAFLPAAERYNLASQLDAWVLDDVLGWLDRSPLFLDHLNVLAVNLSGQSLGDAAFLNHVHERMRRYPLAARKLCFEITETAAISNLDRVQEFMQNMRSFGTRFALDDFGAGLSSFAYLRTLDVDYLKIDGMFVKDVHEDPIHEAMVRSINEVGHVMGKKTIAEFVENDDVREKLVSIGVDFVQGYGIGMPVPFEEVV
ncbi:MAG: diguanylate cyclase (GGDEF)-like protein [Gammaproteobacteria bacterium]|jgi:diguanylate cyclase (GGDEF)-like protein